MVQESCSLLLNHRNDFVEPCVIDNEVILMTIERKWSNLHGLSSESNLSSSLSVRTLLICAQNYAVQESRKMNSTLFVIGWHRMGVRILSWVSALFFTAM